MISRVLLTDVWSGLYDFAPPAPPQLFSTSVNLFTGTFHNFADRSSWPCETGAGTLDGEVREGMDGDRRGLRVDGWGGGDSRWCCVQ